MRSIRLLLAAPIALVIACSSSDSSDASKLNTPSDGSQVDGDPPVSAGGDDAGTGTGSGTEQVDEAASEARARALFDGGTYRSWAQEKTAHASTGPHASSVKVFLNDVLDKSLAAGNAEHPKGSIAIKEFLDGAGEVTGFAYAEKTDDASAEGRGWYWFETFSRDPKGSSIAGQGKPLCANCHAGGQDFVLIPYPLR
jgi:hypothetical protein